MLDIANYIKHNDLVQQPRGSKTPREIKTVALQKIKFQTNIPVEMALKFGEGKLCDSQFGDPQYMFTTLDDQVFFVAEKVAQKIHGLRLKPQGLQRLKAPGPQFEPECSFMKRFEVSPR
jgi:hypothetical protein